MSSLLVLTLLSAAAGAAPAAAQPEVPVLAFAGGLATLVPPTWPRGHVCVAVNLFATDSVVPSAVVAVEGLGASTVTNGSGSGRCDGPAPMETPRLEVHDVDATGRWLQVRIPVQTFPNAGQVAGRVRVYVKGEPSLEFPIQLQASASNPFFQALYWFLGIAIPGVITLYLGQLAFNAQKRSELRSAQQARFRDYVNTHRADLNSLFVVFLPTHCRDQADPVQWGVTLRDRLEEHLSAVPPDEQATLAAALNNGRRAEALALLARLYPEWKTQIASCQ